jgi:hypothetical protein
VVARQEIESRLRILFGGGIQKTNMAGPDIDCRGKQARNGVLPERCVNTARREKGRQVKAAVRLVGISKVGSEHLLKQKGHDVTPGKSIS